MIDCYNIKTPEDATALMEQEGRKIDAWQARVGLVFPRHGSGAPPASGELFERYKAKVDALFAARSYLVKRGLICEDSY